MKAAKVSLPVGSMTNQCPSCGAVFSSISSFDMHRFGAYSDRKCLDTEGMLSKGMVPGKQGWTTGQFGRLEKSLQKL